MGHESVLMRLGVESCKERQIDSTNGLKPKGSRMTLSDAVQNRIPQNWQL